jgi:hypothetical protein
MFARTVVKVCGPIAPSFLRLCDLAALKASILLSRISRISVHCPSSIAACFNASKIFASRALSNFQTTWVASLPRRSFTSQTRRSTVAIPGVNHLSSGTGVEALAARPSNPPGAGADFGAVAAPNRAEFGAASNAKAVVYHFSPLASAAATWTVSRIFTCSH